MLPWLQLCLYGLFTLVVVSWLLLVMQQRLKVPGIDGPPHLGGLVLRCIAALALGCLILGTAPPIRVNGGLDPSWQMVLEHATVNKLIYGKDIVFTFGPLAPASTDWSHGAGHLASERLAYALWLSSVFVLLWWRLSLYLPAWLSSVSWIWLALLPSDAVPYAAIALLGWKMKPDTASSQVDRLVSVLIAPACLAVLGSVKFTYMVASMAVIAAWVLHALVFQRAWLRALLTGTVAALTFMLVWGATGQPLGPIPVWILTGLRVSSAYADSMQVLMVTPTALALSTAVLVATAGAIIWMAIRQTLRKNAEGTFLALVSLGLLAIVWKHSITRADGHLGMINSLGPLLCCLALTQNPSTFLATKHWRTITMATVAIYLITALAGRQTVTGLTVPEFARYQTAEMIGNTQTVSRLLRPATRPLPTDLSSAPELADYRIPNIRRVLDGQPVDVFNFLQCTAFANALNFHPRPVYQSYQSCSADLMDLNLSYWESRTSGQHLLCRMESVDRRLSSSEDATCWPLWLSNLVPSATENDFILLSPSKQPVSKPHWTPLASGTAQINAPLIVPERPPGTLLRLRALPKRSLWGKVVKAAFQPEALEMLTLMADATPETTRIIPSALEAGVVIAPYLHTNVDLLAYYAKDAVLTRRPASITLRPESDRTAEFASSYTYVWETSPAPSFPDEVIQRSRELLKDSRMPFPGRAPALFGQKLPGNIMQVAITTLINIDIDGLSSLRLDAPSKLIFQNDQRGGTLQISYLVPDKSWKRKKPSDGVRFVIATADHDGKENVLLNDFLDPATREADRAKKTFTVTLPPNNHSWIIFRTETGPTDYQDRAIWSGCTWTPAVTGQN